MQKHKVFTEESKDYGVQVAKDIVEKDRLFKDLTSKQQWRINQVLGMYEVFENGSTYSTDVENNTKDAKNNVYVLDEHPDIKAKVEKVQSKADSVEMQEVLKQTPNVLKICYSILKYGKASEKQLKHVNIAVEILEQA